MRRWLFQVKYVTRDGSLVDFGDSDYTYCAANARTQTVALARAVAHIRREQRRSDLGWELHSITFAASS